MISYDFGDVVLVPFPFTDQTTSKRRPAIVISSEALSTQSSRYHLDITSQAKPAGSFGEVPVDEWKKPGLLKPSVIKPVVGSIEKSLVIRKLGRLEEPDQKKLRSALKSILG